MGEIWCDEQPRQWHSNDGEYRIVHLLKQNLDLNELVLSLTCICLNLVRSPSMNISHLCYNSSTTTSSYYSIPSSPFFPGSCFVSFFNKSSSLLPFCLVRTHKTCTNIWLKEYIHELHYSVHFEGIVFDFHRQMPISSNIPHLFRKIFFGS